MTQTLNWCQELEVEFISVKQPGPDPILCQALEHHGFYVTDNVVRLIRPSGQAAPEINFTEGFAFSSQIDDPAATARVFHRLFYDGRFHNDAAIPEETADLLWETAIKNQLDGGADHFLILEHEAKPIGLVTIQKLENNAQDQDHPPGSVFVLGVLEKFRNRGWGRLLLAEAIRRYQRNYSRLIVETSTFNHPAIRLYLSLGFQWDGFKLSLHWRRSLEERPLGR
ncbi:MAG: GNAT family N-acetyltransferase [Pseudomonadota bacterium]